MTFGRLQALYESLADPRDGLDDDVFYFVSALTPMVNVDLLIQNDTGGILLTWREDRYYGPGWHIPGGILRFKERAAERIAKVAHGELGAEVLDSHGPIMVQELHSHERNVRGHFISLLYRCRLTSAPASTQRADRAPKHGQWSWHAHAPDNLIKVQKAYRDLFR
jgi:colanic acid biosynthesis protein WcaH